MTTAGCEAIQIRQESDIVAVRQRVRTRAQQLGFSLVDQTKLVTAASELARNVYLHGGGGRCTIEVVQKQSRVGLQLVFEDQGPGIADLSTALHDGFSSADGFGLGLGGARRLVNEFDIQSAVGKGTRVVVVRWK